MTMQDFLMQNFMQNTDITEWSFTAKKLCRAHCSLRVPDRVTLSEYIIRE